ncbi:MAG: hypothetical protein AAF927_24105 [Bacteroidota bacterium]
MPDAKCLFLKVSQSLAQRDSLSNPLFLSMGDQEVPKMKTAFDLMLDLLEREPKLVHWQSLYAQGAIHSNNAQLSAPIEIEWILNLLKPNFAP